MSSLFETITQTLGGGALGQISKQLGSDDSTTGSAIGAALPMLIGALSRNASNDDGAQSLSNALAKDHDGSVLDNLSGLLGNPQGGAGDGILKHVLGSRRQNVERGLSQTTGMDSSSVGSLLTMLAPMVMGALGKQQRQNNMNPSALASMLNQEQQHFQKQAPKEMGILEKLLDTDGDGDVDLGDITKHGIGVLGKLFGGR